MGIFNLAGSSLLSAYSISGNTLSIAYDLSGEMVFPSDWREEITLQELRNTVTNTTYYTIRIPKVRPNGMTQFPFVFAPNGAGVPTQSTLEMNRQYGFCMAINSGVFDMNSGSLLPVGTIIQNSIVIQQGTEQELSPFPSYQYVLTIDDNGDFGYESRTASAQNMVSDGIVSAVQIFTPVVIDFVDAYKITHSSVLISTADAQRQIIGQYSNGDYFILTAEGRGFKDSTGFTMPEVRELCLSLGLKNAFMLDGGGSTETVIGDEQINTIYEAPYGRKVPTYIVFNGTDTFSFGSGE